MEDIDSTNEILLILRINNDIIDISNMFKESITLSSVKCITKLNSFYPLDYSNFDSDDNLSLLKYSQDNIYRIN